MMIFKSIFPIVACVFFVNCSPQTVEKPEPPLVTERKIIVVKVPPPFDAKLSNGERYWKFQKFLFPQTEIPKKIPKLTPHDDSLLHVTLGEDESVTINTMRIGDLSEVELLQRELEEIFRKRAEMRVLETNSERVVKAVLIIAPDSARYDEVFRLIEAVENGGADPIVLKIGTMPNVSIISLES